MMIETPGATQFFATCGGVHMSIVMAVSINGGVLYPIMDGLFHGKSQSKMDD